MLHVVAFTESSTWRTKAGSVSNTCRHRNRHGRCDQVSKFTPPPALSGLASAKSLARSHAAQSNDSSQRVFCGVLAKLRTGESDIASDNTTRQLLPLPLNLAAGFLAPAAFRKVRNCLGFNFHWLQRTERAVANKNSPQPVERPAGR